MKKVKFSNSWKRDIDKYFIHKDSKIEYSHALEKYSFIIDYLDKISLNKIQLSKKVKFGNSKDLHYFNYQKHTIFFKVSPRIIKVMYFVASKRVKKSIF